MQIYEFHISKIISFNFVLLRNSDVYTTSCFDIEIRDWDETGASLRHRGRVGENSEIKSGIKHSLTDKHVDSHYFRVAG